MILVIAGLQLIGHPLAMRVPLKMLRQRTPVAPPWPKEDRQRLALEHLPLTVVVGTATIAFLLLLYFAVERPTIGPISVALIVAGIAALAWATVQGTRKWRLARNDHAASNLT